MNNYVAYVCFFIFGFAVGAGLCYLILAQIYKHKRVKDELLKARRNAAKAQRTLDRFIKTSLDMFSDLDLVHRQYAMFLNETAQRLAPLEEKNHPFMTNDNSRSNITKGIADPQIDIDLKVEEVSLVPENEQHQKGETENITEAQIETKEEASKQNS